MTVDRRTGRPFPRGARPTPRHKLCAAPSFVPYRATPATVAYVPAQLSYWLNNQYGDCVTAEEAFKCACDTPEDFIQDSTVQAWASQNGVLDGADLSQVMDAMAKSGFQQDGKTYGDGPYMSVDYSNEAVLQAALAEGPVKIGIDASALPSGAGNQMGWYATGGSPGSYTNEDHCVSLCGYGTVTALYSALGVPAPAISGSGYLLFTWNTIGFVDHAWIMSTCGEAWLRQPNTTINGVPQPNPSPGPTPTPPPTPTPTPPFGPVWQWFLNILKWLEGLIATKQAHGVTPSAFPWSILLAVLQVVIETYGPTAIPWIEAELAKLPIPATILAAIDAYLNLLLPAPPVPPKQGGCYETYQAR